MARNITHGQVRRASEANKYAVAVELLTFPTLAPVGPLPPTGTQGTLTTKTVPHTPYTKFAPPPPPAPPQNMTIVYEDGNNNNTVRMWVRSVVGPAKYNMTVL